MSFLNKTYSLEHVKLDEIEYLDSETFDEEKEYIKLLASIKKRGLFVPVILQKQPNSKYKIFSGKRRVAAFRALMFSVPDTYEKIPSIVIEDEISGEMKEIIFYEENKIRKKMSLLEEGKWFFSALAISIMETEKNGDVDNLQYSRQKLIEKGIKYFNSFRSAFNNSSKPTTSDEDTSSDITKKVYTFINDNSNGKSITSLYNLSKLLVFPKELQKLYITNLVGYELASKINKLFISDSKNENKIAKNIVAKIEEESNGFNDSIGIYEKIISQNKDNIVFKKIKTINNYYLKFKKITNSLTEEEIKNNDTIISEINSLEKHLKRTLDKLQK